MFEVFFPITGMYFDPTIIFFTGLLGGFVSGFLGIGCGVIITPLLFDLKLPPFIAISTQLCHAVGTNFSNFLAYARKRDVDFHFVLYILIGGCFGATCEWLFLKYANNSQTVLNKFLYVYISVLIIFGFIMLHQSLQALKKSKQQRVTYSIIMRRWMLYLPLHKIFLRSRTEMSVLIPIFLGFLTGILVASLGGGNNLFMAPIITYLIGRISPVVHGTTSMAGFIITAIVAIIYANNSYYCDIYFVLILFAGAAIGSCLGVRLTYKLRRCYINIISSITVFFMAVRQVYRLLFPQIDNISEPTNLCINKYISLNYISLNPEGYTIGCIVLIIVVAFFYEKGLNKIIHKITAYKNSSGRLRK